MLLEQKISETDYERKTAQMRSRQNQLAVELENLSVENTNSHITARTVLELARRAGELVRVF